MALDKDLQNFYEDAFSMMATPGWKTLMEDVSKIKANFSDITSVTDAQQLFFRQGQVDNLNWLLGLKGLYEQAYEELTSEEQ
jgi:hypothetical protein